MASRNEERLRQAMRGHTRRAVEYHGARPEYAVVEQLNPVQAKRASDDAPLHAGDDVLFGHAVKQYDVDYGIEVGDTLVIHLMEDGNYAAVDVLHDTLVTPSGGGGVGPPGPPGADAPPPEAVHIVAAGGEPAFQNGWVNYGAGERGAGFYKDRGRLYFQGLIKDGAVPAVAWVLPPTHRPPNYERVPIATSNDGFGANVQIGHLRVDPDGTVRIIVGSNVAVSLEGVSIAL